ncbi:hypothetical protein NMG29_19225 [Streptomyces cocklensis]|nr:sigma factor [Actinacidiphila cocklensis]MDD1060304.1 hypothetical protein [Actinacidiphila cocklensis]
MFFRENKPELLRLAVGRLRNLSDADEALMDAALQIHRKWPVVQAHANPMALARRIVKSSCIDYYRRRARRDDRETALPETGYPTAPSADDLLEMRGHERLDHALATLESRAPKQAECVRLKFLGGCSSSVPSRMTNAFAASSSTASVMYRYTLFTASSNPAASCA